MKITYKILGFMCKFKLKVLIKTFCFCCPLGGKYVIATFKMSIYRSFLWKVIISIAEWTSARVDVTLLCWLGNIKSSWIKLCYMSTWPPLRSCLRMTIGLLSDMFLFHIHCLLFLVKRILSDTVCSRSRPLRDLLAAASSSGSNSCSQSVTSWRCSPWASLPLRGCWQSNCRTMASMFSYSSTIDTFCFRRFLPFPGVISCTKRWTKAPSYSL